jgi:predicted dienelactone hydrolase
MVAVRVADVRFVLDRLGGIRDGGNSDAEGRRLPRGLASSLDLSKVGVFGHSAGGFTAAEAMLDDTRIDAGVNLDGSMIYSSEEGEYGEMTEHGLDRPFMLVGAGTSGSDDLPHTHRDAPDWGAFWQSSTGPKLDLHVPEGEHFTFTDYQAIMPQFDGKLGLPDWILVGMVGTVDPHRIVASQRAYVAAFFDRHLKGEDRGLLEAPSPGNPDVDFVR